MRNIILIILFITIQINAFAQKPDYLINLEKYWWYRYTLVNDYMKIGPNCGESIPGERHMHNWDLPPNQYDPNASYGHMHWGDATILMGQYMQLLATEHELLRLAHLNTERTEYEIYMVLNAFDRLDLTAEERMRNFAATQSCENINPHSNMPYNDPTINDLNGFFIRDDAYPGFVNQNSSHFNRSGGCGTIQNETSAVVGRIDGNVPAGGNVYTTWSNVHPNVPHYPVEMSQDQVAEIYAGLALLVRILHGSITYNNVSLKEKATDALLRLVKYCSLPGPGIFQITNPVSGLCVYGVNPTSYNKDPLGFNAINGHCLDGGAVITPSAPALVNGLWKLGINWNTTRLADAMSVTSMGNLHDPTYQWAKYFHSSGSCADVSGNQAIFLYTFSAFSRSMRNLLQQNVTRKLMIKASVNCDFRWPHLPLMYRLINGGDQFYPAYHSSGVGSYENLLDKAPKCLIRNYGYPNNNSSPWEWSSPNRLHDPFKRGNSEQSEYPGLSFMVLYNLYALNTTTTTSHYIKKMRNDYYAVDMNETFPLNINGTLYGTSASQYTYNTLEFLSTRSRIQSNADVRFRNANQIILLPDFETDKGATFEAFIEEYSCCITNNGEGASSVLPENNNGFSMDDLWGNTIDPYELPEVDPEDPDYDYSDSAFTADSLTVIDQILDSGDNIIIDYMNSINGNDSSQNKPTYTTLLANNMEMTIYPNPNSGSFTIELSQKGDYEIRVVNIVGATVYQTKLNDEQKKEIQLNNNLPSGNYLIHISGKDFRHIEKVTLIK